MHVVRDGQPLTQFGYAKVQALLAYLTVEAERPHMRDVLAELFWPEQPPGAARVSLRQALAHLRRALDDPDAGASLITTTRTSVQLIPSEQYWLDLTAFDELLLACHQIAGGEAEDELLTAQRLQQAGALYRGDFLEGFPLIDCPAFDEWVAARQIALRTRMLQALDCLAGLYEHHGAYGQAMQIARRQIAIEAWHEAAHCNLMRLLALSGERDAALAQFAQCRIALQSHLDMSPAPETLELYAQLKAGAALPPAMQKQPRPPPSPPLIPAQPDALFGREHELHTLHTLLRDPAHRLVTITGPGGIGKTRLALQAAHDLSDYFAHGVHLVRLAEFQNNATLVATLANALPLQLEGQRTTEERLLAFLAGRQLLLLLDNAEYALDGLNTLVTILEAAPNVTLLATSRERLRLRWEWRLELGGLALSNAATNGTPGAAVQLFDYCARRVAPEFDLNDATYPLVARICRLLEGVPLGIELAASSLASTDCATIARQLAANLTMLQTDLRDLPERHLSLWNICQHSWNFLHVQEQRRLCRLAVFRGGFTLAAARAVADTTEEVLSRLMDKSLLRHDQSGRYSMHEFIRQFAAEQLAASGEESGIRDRHLDYYIGLAERYAIPLGNGPQDQQLAALQDLTIETANWRAALTWAEASARTLPPGMRLVAALAWYWHYHGDYSVTRQICEHWLVHAEAAGTSEEYAAVCATFGHIAYAQGDYAAARDVLEPARRRLQQTSPSQLRGSILSYLGLVHLLLGDLALAHNYTDEAQAIFETIDDHGGLSHTQYVQGGIYQAEGAYDEACACFEASLAYNLAQQNIFAILALVASLGTLKRQMGHTHEAEVLCSESITRIRAYRMGVFLPDAFEAMAHVLQTGGWIDAAAMLREAVRSSRS
jgi:predicted ATPase/DNA-binding SARP family transcriptional activator